MNPKSRNARSKKTSKSNLSITSPAEDVDDFHSLGTPACALVATVSADILPESSLSEQKSEPSKFGVMARKHLFVQRKANQPSKANIKNKKRKKKKKKKKGSDGSLSESSSMMDCSENSNTTCGNSSTGQNLDSPESSPQGGKSLRTLPSTVESIEDEDNTSVDVVASSVSLLSLKSQESLERRPEVVDQWMNRLESVPETTVVDQTVVDQTLVEFCKDLNNKKEKPSILVSDISKALSCTTCATCRSSADSYWHGTGIPMHELGLASDGHHQKCVTLEPSMIFVPHQSSSSKVHPIEGMEETICKLINVDEVTADTDATTVARNEAQIVQFEPVIGQDGVVESLKVSSELDASAVERLLRKVILPCGLYELEHAEAYNLSDAQFESICGHVSKLEPLFYEDLKKLGNQRAQIRMTFDAAVHKEADFDLTAAKVLSQCDTNCDVVFGTLFVSLMEMTAMADCLPYAEWAHNRTEGLWDSSERALRRIVNSQIRHDRQQTLSANRMGCVPQVFCDAELRNSMRSLVQDKLEALESFYMELFTELTGGDQSPQGPTLVRKVVTYEHFVVKTGQGKVSSSLKKTELDVALKHLIQTFARLTYTRANTQVSEIQQARRQNCTNIIEMLKECRAHVNKECSSVKKEKYRTLDDLRGKFDDLMLEAQDALNEDASISDMEEGTGRDMREVFTDLVSNMTKTWRRLRALRSQSVRPPVMPLRLEKWMSVTKINAVGNSVCTGGGGKRRFASVLASLLYQWLSSRCDRWYSERNEMELLVGLESSKPMELESSKSKKKSKKKKSNQSSTAKEVEPQTRLEAEAPTVSEGTTSDVAASGSYDSALDSALHEDFESSTRSPTSVRNRMDPQLSLATAKHTSCGVEESKEEHEAAAEESKEEDEPEVISGTEEFGNEEVVAVTSKKTREPIAMDDAMEEKKEEEHLYVSRIKESQSVPVVEPKPLSFTEETELATVGVEDDCHSFETAESFLVARLAILQQMDGSSIVEIS